MTPTASAAAMTARTPSARNSGVASAVASLQAIVDPIDLAPSGRRGQASPVLQLLAAPRDRGGAMDEASEGPPHRRVPVETTAIRRPDDVAQVDGRVPLGDVLVDLAVGESGQRRVAGHDEHLGLRRADSERPAEDVLGEREGRLGILRTGSARERPPWRLRRWRSRPRGLRGGSGLASLFARLTTCRLPPGRRGSARPAPRARRAPSGTARPCRSSGCRASRSSGRRRPRRTSARTRT